MGKSKNKIRTKPKKRNYNTMKAEEAKFEKKERIDDEIKNHHKKKSKIT